MVDLYYWYEQGMHNIKIRPVFLSFRNLLWNTAKKCQSNNTPFFTKKHSQVRANVSEAIISFMKKLGFQFFNLNYWEEPNNVNVFIYIFQGLYQNLDPNYFIVNNWCGFLLKCILAFHGYYIINGNCKMQQGTINMI